MMDHLPQEILSDILLRLPVESLLLLCCVSKKLYAFITGLFFVEEHFRHSQNNGGRRLLRLKRRRSSPYHDRRRSPLYSYRNLKTQLSICSLDEDQSPGVVDHDLELPFSRELVVRLFGSCNGIVCISVASNVYLCNPTTRRYLTLPRFSFASNYAVTHGMGLGFDPVTQNYQVIRLVWFLAALELDPSTIHRDFEVASLLTDKPSFETFAQASSRGILAQDLTTLDEGWPSILSETLAQSSSSGILSQGWPTMGAEVYNLNTNSWRKLDVVLPHIDERNSAAVLNDRYFHWCTKYRRILSFDMNTQSFRQMEIPREVTVGVDGLTPTWNVGVLDNSLAFMFVLDNSLAFMFSYRKNIDVWVMEEYGMQESWTRKYSIRAPIWSIGTASLSSWNDGELFMVCNTGPELISCSLSDDCNKMKNYGGILRAVNYSLAYVVYQESLVSLYRGHNGMPWQAM